MFRYRCPLKPPVFPIRAVTIDTLMEGLSSLTYILLVALCAGDQINHILGFAVCLVFEFHWRAVGRLGNLSRCMTLQQEHALPPQGFDSPGGVLSIGSCGSLALTRRSLRLLGRLYAITGFLGNTFFRRSEESMIDQCLLTISLT